MAVRTWITGILLLAVAYFLTIWFPFWEYYSVSTSDDVSSEQVSVLQHKPSSEALSALFVDDAITISLDNYDVQVSVNSTRSMIDHGIVLPGMAHPIHVVPFNPVSLDVSNSSWQLAAHSLTVAKHLLDLYEREKDPLFLTMAKDYILAYATYERINPYKSGFLYNDHAVSARAVVVAKLWYLYRTSPVFDLDQAQEIFAYADRIGSRLLKRSYYTYKTNHGTMQNVALMVLAATFSELGNAKSWGKVGLDRLEEQLTYLVSKDGFFLEHSFGYHLMFIDILAMGVNAGKVEPLIHSSNADLMLQKAKAWLPRLARSDGRMAVVGDTGFKKQSHLPPYGDHNRAPLSIYPETGLAFLNPTLSLRCQQHASELTVYWSNFAKHGHKHWDDMSVDLYLCGEQWWRAAGYIPYWHKLRKSAERWQSANAPHIVTESAPASNRIQSIEHADLPELRYFRIERDSGKGIISRDVITFSNDTFVIDQFVQESGAEISDEQFRVSWTMSADKVLDDKLSAPAKNRFVFSGAVEDQKLHSQFSGSESTKIELLNKSSNSVLGWVEHEGKVEGAYTLDIQSSITNGTAWIMNASFLEHNTGCTPLATFSKRAISAGTVNSDNYSFTLSVQGCGRDYEVTRNRGVIELNTNTPQRVAITSVPDDFKSEVTRINSVTQDIFDEYGPRFRPLLSYRIKISIFGCVILVVVLLSILLLRYIQLPNRVRSAYMYSTLLAWSGLVVWVSFFYFN